MASWRTYAPQTPKRDAPSSPLLAAPPSSSSSSSSSESACKPGNRGAFEWTASDPFAGGSLEAGAAALQLKAQETKELTEFVTCTFFAESIARTMLLSAPIMQ